MINSTSQVKTSQVKKPFTLADLKKIFSSKNIISVAKRALKLLQGFFSRSKIILQVIYKKFLRKIIPIKKPNKIPNKNNKGTLPLKKPNKILNKNNKETLPPPVPIDKKPNLKEEPKNPEKNNDNNGNEETLPPPVPRDKKPNLKEELKNLEKNNDNEENHTTPNKNIKNGSTSIEFKISKTLKFQKNKPHSSINNTNINPKKNFKFKTTYFLEKNKSIKFYQKLIHTEIQKKAIKKIVKKLMSIQPQKKIKIQNIKKKKTTKNSKKKNKKEEYLYKVTLNLFEIAKFIPQIPFTINKIIKKGNRDACAIDFLRLLYEDLDSRKKTAYLLNNHKKHAGIKIFMKNTFSGIIYNIKQSKFQFGKKSLKGFVSSLTKTQKDSENLIKKLAPHFKKMDKFEEKTDEYRKFFKRKTKIIKKPLFTEEDYKKLLAILFPKSLYLKTPTPPSSS